MNKIHHHQKPEIEHIKVSKHFGDVWKILQELYGENHCFELEHVMDEQQTETSRDDIAILLISYW